MADQNTDNDQGATKVNFVGRDAKPQPVLTGGKHSEAAWAISTEEAAYRAAAGVSGTIDRKDT